MPPLQVGLPFKDKYLMMVNPYPIFHHHFTIALMDHTPQLMKDRFRDMLDLAHEVPCLTVFYNGAKCGASAPDHFHFQAVTTGIMPVERDASNSRYTRLIFETGRISIATFNNYLRNGVILRSPYAADIEQAFDALTASLPSVDGEPMMNVIASHNEDIWQVIILPRDKHRPECYYSSKEDNLLLSPASVDLGGVCILPREEDFQKASPEAIKQAFMEVSRSDIGFENDMKRFLNRLKNIWP